MFVISIPLSYSTLLHLQLLFVCNYSKVLLFNTSYYSIVDALFFCIPNTISPPLEKINIHLDEVDSKRVLEDEEGVEW